MNAVLSKLQIPVSKIDTHLKLDGKTLASEAPVNFCTASNSGLIELTLAPRGLVGGSLSPRAELDDEFKRVSGGEDQVVIIPTKKS